MRQATRSEWESLDAPHCGRFKLRGAPCHLASEKQACNCHDEPVVPLKGLGEVEKLGEILRAGRKESLAGEKIRLNRSRRRKQRRRASLWMLPQHLSEARSEGGHPHLDSEAIDELAYCSSKLGLLHPRDSVPPDGRRGWLHESMTSSRYQRGHVSSDDIRISTCSVYPQ